MNAIVAVDSNWAIGNKGQLLVSIPNDHKMFRKETLDKVIVYGRKTLETFPLAQPLDKRTNIIVSSNPDYKVKGALVVHSIPELLEELKQYDTDDVYIIGGASIYRKLLPYCDTCLVTVNDFVPEEGREADSWFPDLDAMPDWERTEEGAKQEHEGIHFRFCTYRRRRNETSSI